MTESRRAVTRATCQREPRSSLPASAAARRGADAGRCGWIATTPRLVVRGAYTASRDDSIRFRHHLPGGRQGLGVRHAPSECAVEAELDVSNRPVSGQGGCARGRPARKGLAPYALKMSSQPQFPAAQTPTSRSCGAALGARMPYVMSALFRTMHARPEALGPHSSGTPATAPASDMTLVSTTTYAGRAR